ncbi:MAG TPA: transketolase [Anaerolineae bacterium]|nr:transketolase [Anaerolineae bacterium]
MSRSAQAMMANTIRGLAMDAVQKANSGHPGMPMGMADAATVLWTEFLKHNPHNPHWFDRDRFVLSAGHGSMLLYALLYLTGYGLSLDDIKNFRQLGSKTAGHPEYGHAAGIETTTGPLGQGVSNAVGMAIAEKWLGAQFNRPNYQVVDHYTYVICGDGDLMEGISHESLSLAGHLELGKLIVLYDDNEISIDGSTDLSMTEDVLARFAAYGWHTQAIDGHNLTAVQAAVRLAQLETARPSLIACSTLIGFGSPNKAGTASVHGSPLGEEEIKLTKERLEWPQEPFYVPEETLEFGRLAVDAGSQAERQWKELLEGYAAEYPKLAAQFGAVMRDELPEGWEKHIPVFEAGKGMATRASSGKVLEGIVPHVPSLLGGSADLTGSNKTRTSQMKGFQGDNETGNYLYYGVREHGMGAIMNGLALHGGVRPFGGTFLVFSDYMRGAMRLSALMKVPVIYVLTHDSIGLGEDGPTHQPIEHLMSLRLMPGMQVLRPADANEVAVAWQIALKSQGPSCIVLSRQGAPTLDRTVYAPASEAWAGGYVVRDADDPQVILIGTGTELSQALAAAAMLADEGIRARVVSMMSWELFAAQTEAYQESVLPSGVTARVSMEAGATLGWERYVGAKGKAIGLDRFGASAPAEELYKVFGLTAEAMVAAAKELLNA